MKRIALLAFLLSGCMQTPVLEPGPEVDVPIAVHCAHAPLNKPAFPLQTLSKNAGATQLLQACLQNDLLHRAYELRCEAIVKTCK